jgi:hypothetical protein
MFFEAAPVAGMTQIKLKFTTKDKVELSTRIHGHAFSQMCARLGITGKFLKEAHVTKDAWKASAVAHLLQEYFHNTKFNDKSGQVQFLNRFVGDELRGFVSRKFNRWLASEPLLDAFLFACDMNNVVPVEAVASDIRLSLKCVLPFIFEPVPGEFICFGINWTNSDFGAGRLTLATTIWSARTHCYSVLDTALSRVHLGSVLEDSDLEISADTAEKEVIAQCAAIRDTVTAQLSFHKVDRLLSAIEAAYEAELSWSDIKKHISRFLTQTDVDKLKLAFDSGVVDLPPLKVSGAVRTASAWWLTSSVSWLAQQTTDGERKLELQNRAGALLEPYLSKEVSNGGGAE